MEVNLKRYSAPVLQVLTLGKDVVATSSFGGINDDNDDKMTFKDEWI